MSLSFELACAILLRKKRHKFKDSPLFSAFIGITLSIVPLVLVLEVSDGMISGIMNRYIETFYSHVMLRFYREPSELDNFKKRIREIPNAQTVYFERNGAALLIVGKSRVAVQVRSLEKAAFEQDQGLRKYLDVNSGKIALSPGSILLASDVAFKLQVQVGDEVALLTGAQFGKQLRPRTEKFLVRGIVGTGYQELDRLWVFIPYQDAQSFFHYTNSQLLLHIKTDDAFHFEQLKEVSHQVQKIISPGLAQVRSWYSQASELQQSYQFTKSILVYIMYLIVAVGTINIASSMVMLVLENSSEIAIMKTFGAGKALILNIYIWVAILVSCLAVFCGIVAGFLICYFINEIIAGINVLLHMVLYRSSQNLDLLDKSYYLEHIPIQIEILPIVIMVAIVLLFTFFCSMIPALKAAKMYPLDILQKNRS